MKQPISTHNLSTVFAIGLSLLYSLPVSAAEFHGSNSTLAAKAINARETAAGSKDLARAEITAKEKPFGALDFSFDYSSESARRSANVPDRRAEQENSNSYPAIFTLRIAQSTDEPESVVIPGSENSDPPAGIDETSKDGEQPVDSGETPERKDSSTDPDESPEGDEQTPDSGDNPQSEPVESQDSPEDTTDVAPSAGDDKGSTSAFINDENTQIQAEVEYIDVVDATNTELEQDDYLTKIVTNSNFELTENLSLLVDTEIIFDEERNIFGFEERFLDRKGINIDMLYLRYQTDRSILKAGFYEPTDDKFPNAPAFFGNFANYISVSEKIGFGGSIRLSDDLIDEHWLTAHVFHLDTSVVSAPLFSDEKQTKLEDGGVSNTEKFDNYLAMLDGSVNYQDRSLNYVAGYALQRAGEGQEFDEKMTFASLYGLFEPSEEYEFELILDHVFLENAGGNPEDHSTITVGAYYNQWPFGLGFAYSEREVTPRDEADAERTDRIFEIISRYFIGDHLGIEAAVETLEDGDAEEILFGIVAIYYFEEIPFPAEFDPASLSRARKSWRR